MNSKMIARQICERLREELATTTSLVDVLSVVLQSYSTTFQKVCEYDSIAASAFGGTVSVCGEFEFSIGRQIGDVARIAVKLRYSPDIVDNQSMRLLESFESPDELREFIDQIKNSDWFPAVGDAAPTRGMFEFSMKDNELSTEELREVMGEEESREFRNMFYSNKQESD